MKKIKYLLSFLVVGLGLLFSNYGFCVFNYNVYVEGVTLPLTDSSFSSSSNYLYTFSNFQSSLNKPSIPASLQYVIYKDGIVYNSCSSSTYNPSILCYFNNSVFGLSLYTGRDFVYYDHVYNQTTPGYSPVKFAFGQGDQFGKNFIYTNNVLNDSGILTPHYSFGGGFFSNNDFATVSSSTTSNLNFFRIFFNQNVNLSSPLDGFEIEYSSGSNMPGSGSVARMQLTQNSNIYQTRYNSSQKYLIDYGSQGTKGLTFGGYGVGYSSAVNFSQDYNTLYWGNWSFSSLGSRCGLSAMQLGITDFNTLTSNNCLNLGLLVLKGDSYVSRNNNASVLILGKDPTDYSKILYQQFDCAEDDIIRIMDSSFCTSLGHGYITYNGSSAVLPFLGTGDFYTLGSGNRFLDLIFNNGIYGYVQLDSSNNQYCIKSSSYDFCFKLVTTPNSTSLKELYLQNSGDIGGNGGTVGGTGLDDIVINKPTSYYTYSGLLVSASSSVFYSGYDIDSNINFINSGLDYTFVNGVPALTEYHFGFCPFTSVFGEVQPTLSFDGFSFDLLSPFKCLLNSFQYGFLNLNSPSLDSISNISPIISNVSFSVFIWVILYGGLIIICFKFLNKVI